MIGLPGDFNGDGIVDAGDFVVWRNNLGADETGSTLNGNGTGSAVDEDDYDLWKLNFGNSNGIAALSATTVPEPGAIVLMLLTAICLTHKNFLKGELSMV